MLRLTSLTLTLFLTLLLPQTVASQTQDEIQALATLSELKIYFDVKADSAAKLEKRLLWIHDTYDQARQKGLKATFVVGFRSQASMYLTTDDDFLDEKEIVIKVKIKKWLQNFVTLGIHMEQCGLSAELFDIEPEDFLPELSVVKNGYLSIAGYQNRGYAYVPM